MIKEEFPKFIQNKALGQDSFEGKSAERVAKAIENHIEKVTQLNNGVSKTQLPQIIGLEGPWGSGKSNVIRILKTNLEGKSYLFEYDAWGNQEDLQRRSFLELLTHELIDEGILDGDTHILKRDGGKEKVTWKEKLKYLLARKTETISEKYPRISNGMAVVGLVAILTPIFVFAGYVIKTTGNNDWWTILISILISLLPCIASLVIWIIASKKDSRYKSIGYLLAIYNDKIENDVAYETISDSEPTVSEFKAWMTDISDYIETNKKIKLVLVFDNMDRLPPDKVRDLWSSIHTFFSEDGNPNIWVIIPFDKKHLANAFGENSITNETELTGEFISKTFPIIYTVSPAILTDRKEIFYKLFIDAFGTSEEEARVVIQRIFALIKAKFTPRDIIAFINELVSLKQMWKDEIPLIPISIYVLRKSEIISKNIDEYILSNAHLVDIERIIEKNDEMQKYLAALTYGIDVNMAEQIPLKQYLRETLKGSEGYDINKFSDKNHFLSILEDELKNVDPAVLNKAILSLSELNQKELKLLPLWNQIARVYLDQKSESNSFSKVQEALLLNVNEYYKKEITKHLCTSYRSFQEFQGGNYFIAVNDLDIFLNETKIDISLSEYIHPLEVEAQNFIDYVSVSKDNFSKYPIFCNNEQLDSYLALALPELPNMDFLKYLFDSGKYTFDSLREKIEKLITDKSVDANSFPEIIKAYKAISKGKPLKQQFTDDQVSTILSATTDTKSEAYFDLIAMGLAMESIDTPFVEGLDKKVAERIEYYLSYGELLKASVNWASILLRKVCLLLTSNSYGVSTMAISQILPLYLEIKSAIGVTDSILLTRLNSWSKYALSSITMSNIDAIIPNSNFYKVSAEINNELTTHIHEVTIAKLNSIPINDLYNHKDDSTYHWLNTAALMIQGNSIKALPDNLIEFCKRILKEISTGMPIPIAGSIIDVILNKADKRKLNSIIRSIGDDFCNRLPVITPEQFLYLSSNFNLIGNIQKREGAIARNILHSVISEPKSLDYILEKPEGFIEIVNKADSEAEDLKAEIKQLLKTNSTDKMKYFANAIRVVE